MKKIKDRAKKKSNSEKIILKSGDLWGDIY
jgi:hypothetical protein